jgi:hypothetical protein
MSVYYWVDILRRYNHERNVSPLNLGGTSHWVHKGSGTGIVTPMALLKRVLALLTGDDRQETRGPDLRGRGPLAKREPVVTERVGLRASRAIAVRVVENPRILAIVSTRRRSIEQGRFQGQGRIVNDSGQDGVVANE